MKVNAIGKRQPDPDGVYDHGTRDTETRRVLMSLKSGTGWHPALLQLTDLVTDESGLTWADDVIALFAKHDVSLIYDDDITLFDRVFAFFNELCEADAKRQDSLSDPQQDGDLGEGSEP